MQTYLNVSMSFLYMKQKVTLSIDTETYKKYKEFCEANAIQLSKKIELFMKDQIGK